ncbi:type I-C CRISPR-associated protein Cas8c/Csd1 [Fuscovulum blasticum]|uniref:type I-C CRISPR-associated protein Cas8c/Csd1 n=1 Tax=Fuscovulum blasticum TaxID=1075 RepID=UPI000D3E03BB|nr:type I-C CRISPR-associated protein Cas8c/Csd1 [Fuscovulum blasticum]AWD22348.1 type I-C CRISPR-associated protein Cas8c/Csd1 [Fuscovulum blasticum]
MSLLSALAAAYDRLPHAPPYGYSSEKIGFCVILNPDGTVAEVADLRGTDKKRSPRIMQVPAAPKRSGSTPRPNFTWDNINYALGAGLLGDPNDCRFDAFKAKHLEYLRDLQLPDARAFCRFLETWDPCCVADYFDMAKPPTEGVVFALAGNPAKVFLHELPELHALWSSEGERWKAVEGKSSADAICLLTGRRSPIARTHAAIKGVWGAQVAGAALVSFNSDAYESYGHEQGDNAPVSEAATFAYTTALNLFLSDKHHRLQIGDTSTVFWAEAEESAAAEAESLFAGFFDTAPTRDDLAATEATLAQKVGEKLGAIREGKPLVQILPDLAGARFHVLGLAPNAARLSVRFYWDSTFGQLVANYQRFLADMALEPPPRDGWPPLWRYLVELAVQGKRENVPPLIAGEWMRAILTGSRYPMTLLSTTLMRVRSDGEVNAYRAAILKSVLKRNLSMEAPVALDPANQNKGYILGRLFAVYEEVQRAALGGHVNATIKDKFYGAASATPQKVFRTLDAGSQNHFSKLRKLSAGRAVNLEKLLTSITDLMEPGNDPIPSSLSAAEQALFGIGYYHQRSDFFRKRDEADPEGSPVTDASA